MKYLSGNSFTVGGAGSKEYQENWDRIFGRQEGASEDPVPDGGYDARCTGCRAEIKTTRQVEPDEAILCMRCALGAE